MTTNHVSVQPGRGVAAKHGSAVVLVDTDSASIRATIWDALRRGGVDEVLESLTRDGLRNLCGFVLAENESGTLRLIVRGDVVAKVATGSGEREMVGSVARTWSDQLVDDWSVLSARFDPGAVTPARPDDMVGEGIVAACSIEWSLNSVSNPYRDEIENDSLLSSTHHQGAEGSSAGSLSTPIDTDTGNPDAHSTLFDGSAPVSPRTVPKSVTSALLVLGTDASGATNATADLADSDDDACDEMFGETVSRSVLAAAVENPDDADLEAETDGDSAASDGPLSSIDADEMDGSVVDPGHTWSSSDHSSSVGGSNQDARPDLKGDHDGHTVSLDELNKLHGRPTNPSTRRSPAMSGEGSPVVQALLCSAGHPNPPYNSVCCRCGEELSDSPVSIERPVIGQLRISNGEVYPLDRPALVGRKPDLTRRRFTELPRVIQLDVGDGLSRSHALIHIEEWQVRVEDLGSTNHTTVTLPGRQPQRCREGEPVLIEDGTSIDLGGEVVCIYDSSF